MIYAVTEWYDNSNQKFYFDDSKVDHSNPFEVAYLSLLQRAANSRSKWFEVQNDPSALSAIGERFSSYHNGSSGWSRLTTNPPCQVDFEVSLTMSE